MFELYIGYSEACILVYSISSRSSFEQIAPLFHHIQQTKKSVGSSPPGPESQMPMPVMLVGSKWDKVTEREVSPEEGIELAGKLGCEFIETSAKTDYNVDKAFQDTVRLLGPQQQPSPPRTGSGNHSSYRGRRSKGGSKPIIKASAFKLFAIWLLKKLRPAAPPPRNRPAPASKTTDRRLADGDLTVSPRETQTSAASATREAQPSVSSKSTPYGHAQEK